MRRLSLRLLSASRSIRAASILNTLARSIHTKIKMSNNPKSRRREEAKAIVSAGPQAASDRLPELVTWLSDQNSPGFFEIAEFLPSLGHVVVPHIKAALQEMDDLGEWQSAILFTQVRHWPRAWLVEIQDELDDLVWYGSQNWGIDEDAALILAENGLGDRDRLQLLITRKREGCLSRLKKLDEIEQKLRSASSSSEPTAG
ncbi:hypothetical protein ANRL2_04159 [Anaerolineae bacterium]|nr:hypothetical protein ANRL2_04159 [Anaerolineae bacterium]